MKKEIITDNYTPENCAFFIPTSLNLVFINNELKIQTIDGKGKTLYRDLTIDEIKRFGLIKNLQNEKRNL